MELYNALNGSDYTDTDALTITESAGVIYMSMRNDVSFLIDTELNLWEHQSTWNPNMPLRGLLYFAQQFNQHIEENGLNLYSSRLLRLPTPRYFVFYNGEQQLPDETDLRFTESLTKPSLSCIEITARVLNINAGHNQALMEASRHLWEYSLFVQTLKSATAGLTDETDIEGAISAAVDQCIAEGILSDTLKQNKKEVIEMFLTEYDEKEHMRRLARDEREIGQEVLLDTQRKAAAYLDKNGRKDDIPRLITDSTFLANTIREAGITYHTDPEREAVETFLAEHAKREHRHRPVEEDDSDNPRAESV